MYNVLHPESWVKGVESKGLLYFIKKTLLCGVGAKVCKNCNFGFKSGRLTTRYLRILN